MLQTGCYLSFILHLFKIVNVTLAAGANSLRNNIIVFDICMCVCVWCPVITNCNNNWNYELVLQESVVTETYMWDKMSTRLIIKFKGEYLFEG